MMHVVLVTYSDWLPNLTAYDCVIAVDSGMKQLAQAQQYCDYWIGDFDSTDQIQLYEPFAKTIIRLPQIKDETDTQAALTFAVATLKATQVTIVTTHSGRFDHQYAQLLLCHWGIEHGVAVEILSPTTVIRLLPPGQYEIAAETYRYLSVFAWQQAVNDLTISEVAYPVSRQRLEPSNPIGISNEIIGSTAKVQFATGLLLVMQSRD